MKFSGCQSFDINWLKGQLITNEHGAEFFIKDVQVDITNHEIVLQLDDGSGVPWNSIKEWSIHFQGKGVKRDEATKAANVDGFLFNEYNELEGQND
jgi:hypothetical protein